jgi:citrate lyase subunit beta-like protein
LQINYKDLELLRHESMEGAQMGFEGKQVIHPGQVGIVQEVFSPSEGAVAAARELVQAFVEHQGKGTGTFVYKGQMIDNPTVLQARNTLSRAGVSMP